AFALAGQIPLTLGVLGHEGSTVIVVLNSLRLLMHHKPASPRAASALPSRKSPPGMEDTKRPAASNSPNQLAD
ncbi:MAG TPA: hypothetical protein DCY13_23230, partial [Verrucomicrobiales bacterium]|nr:hypothetical protein [Verrucomicrobiales bacterium]